MEDVINSMRHLKGLLIDPLKLEDFVQAAELMEEYRIDYENFIHLTVALRKDLKEMVSNDEDFDRTPLRRTF